MNTLAAPSKKRIDSIDIMRGIVMVIMALDHSRDFFSNLQYDPTDLTKASTILFLTRFITHFCAPAFIFLAGTGAFLSLSRGKTTSKTARFLLSRGLWLILLELTVIRVGWIFNLNYHFVLLQVIWAIGISMVVLAALVYLPVRLIAAFGLLLIFFHDTLDKVNPDTLGHAGGIIWRLFHVQGMANVSKSFQVFVLYPLIPWVGVMAVGYSFGALYKLEAARRKKILLTIGISAITLFVILRAINGYGDPGPWSHFGAWHRTVLSFIDVQKYPPSLEYLLITLGAVILALAFLEGVGNRVSNFFVVYGRVPLFYYVLHIYLIRGLAAIAGLICKEEHITFGFGLPVVYAVWILAVSILYFPCRWFMKYKMTHKQWWLSYL